MVNAFRRYVSIACRCVIRRENKTTNAADSSPEKAPLGVPGIPGSSLEPLWRGRTSSRVAITVRPQYYQAKASTYVRTYTCTCVPNCHYTADNDGQIGYRGYATPRQGKVANAGIERNVWDICTRGVGEMDEDEREGGGGKETDGETCGGREWMRFERKREAP